MTSQSTQPHDEMYGLGANERAILERIRWGPARHLAVRGVRLKMRLQFAGWLQYLIPTPVIVVLGLLGGLLLLIDVRWLAAILLVPAGVLALVAAFDIVTTKWKIRFPERRPPRLDEVKTFELLRSRHSCRSFQTRAVSDDDRQALLDAVDTQRRVPHDRRHHTPILEYIAAPLTVWPTVNGSEFLVAIVPKPYDRTAIIDVGRTLQRVVMDATRMGLGTCWIGPGADHDSVIAHLGDRFDATSEQIICVCAVGYRSRYVPLFIRLFNHQMSTRRRALSELFFSDGPRSNIPLIRRPRPTIASAAATRASRWAPSSYNGQTTRAIIQTSPAGDMFAVQLSRPRPPTTTPPSPSASGAPTGNSAPKPSENRAHSNPSSRARMASPATT